MKNFLIVAFVFITLGVSAQTVIWNLPNSGGTNVIAVTDEGNLTISGNLSAAALTASGATTLVSSASAISAGTNTTAAAGIRVRVNGTNYIIRLFAN